MFKAQFGENVKAYIDEMVVKIKEISEHLGNLGKVFSILRKHRLRLNASKFSFGMGSGKFLGYMITYQGIEVNPDQIKAIHDLHPPRNMKTVQCLIGMTTALNKFISWLADWCRPFFQLFHKWKDLSWFEECDKASRSKKKILSSSTNLVQAKEKRGLICLYSYHDTCSESSPGMN